ncbi:serine hydrolase [Nocardiopsis sp. CNR-923]|uniref:serine hydrolase n=1 Tax=Nocardiopsis sp. CNR-923 TaxID=1904965 RepID=UPI000964012B|nr:serine hydrolase [Nocardiopsis sp. CNR-923]OLT24646.1 serine hydrolase [Nocardiopsis sp. CNR-923]
MPRRPPADSRTWPRALAAVTVAVAMALALPGAGSAVRGNPGPAGVAVGDVPLASSAPEPGGAPPTGGSVLPPERRNELAARVASIIDGHGVRCGVAVQDLRTGTTFSHAPQDPFYTASTVKLTILTLLLLRAEEEGRALTASERAEVERMIRYSDNTVTDGLYLRAGFTEGFERGARRLGFTGTEPHPRGRWGATLTTASDQIRLLRALYTDEGPLPEKDRLYVRALMESVAPEQAWGVSAAAGPADTVGLKNGWVPRRSNGGLWNINSVGYVVGPDREYLVAVLSDDHPDYVSGVGMVEELVSLVTGVLEAPGVPVGPGAPAAAIG